MPPVVKSPERRSLHPEARDYCSRYVSPPPGRQHGGVDCVDPTMTITSFADTELMGAWWIHVIDSRLGHGQPTLGTRKSF
jgi:hypothetical protein